jgi:hypothetical protein
MRSQSSLAASRPNCDRGGLRIKTAAQLHLDATAPRRYNLTFVAGAANLFNIVNLGTSNGVLNSPLFGKSKSLASGQFASPTPGNRSVIFQANFSF